ncbi:glycosyl transferase family protein [Halomonas sp. EF61]|uniref:glycosyl transferase family protein n=1 Tax=Halomonas sp. EF61 TaxID=2950869 RepID=UPI0032E03C54
MPELSPELSLWLVDATIHVLFALKYVAIGLCLLMLAMGIDDLFLDLVYWTRRSWRYWSIYRDNPRANEERLYQAREKPLAVMVPAWQEVGVVGQMAQLMASTMDYENYQIFVGTYPNDPETQAEVDAVCQSFSNVHKVVTVRPGPTSKADCLNNIIEAIARFEKAAGIEFAGCILHDAEDVISPMELRLYNYLLPDKDLIQVPVYPFRPRWYQLSGGHYIDEFSEYHGKDVLIREAMCGQVPSAGVGTCFSRRALAHLRELNDGITFDIWSLTEDYDIGFRLHESGLSCVFVRYSVERDELSPRREHAHGLSMRDSKVICVREHFPTALGAVVRQKSRWITGIVFQGYQHLGWSRTNWRLNYFLWRDRRGLVAYPLALVATLLMLILAGLWLYAVLSPQAWHFQSILGGWLLETLLTINGLLLVNRAFQRFYFVKIYYGWRQGLLSFPRMLWSNLVNFLANVRAWKLFFTRARHRTFAWDKTTHDFPQLDDAVQVSLEALLIEDGVVTASDIERIGVEVGARRLPRELIARDLVSGATLARLEARRRGIASVEIHPLVLSPALIDALPRHVALRYATLPIGESGDSLIIATEIALSPVAIGAIGRRIKRPVEQRLVPLGRVTLGLRHWYLGELGDVDRDRLLELDADADAARLDGYCAHQYLLGELLLEQGLITPALFGQAMIDFDPEQGRLGDFLVARGMIESNDLERALALQADHRRQAARSLEDVAV